jgi:putative hydrolase of the HAD superfamily
MGLRALGFDAMGTLFDFNGDARRARTLLAETLCNQGFSAEQVTDMQGAVRRTFAGIAEDTTVPASYREKLQRCFDECMTAAMKQVLSPRDAVDIMFGELPRVAAFDEVHEAMAGLSSQGYELGILSNADPDWFVESVGRIAIEWRAIHRVNWRGHAKPRREAFEAFARAMGAAVDEIVYVGDDLRVDVAGALSAGMHAILVERGEHRHDIEALRRDYPDRLVAAVPHIASLLDLLRDHPLGGQRPSER